MKHRRLNTAPLLLAAALTLVIPAGTLFAQVSPAASSADLTRQLEQVRRDTRLLASPDLKAGERAIIDYGGYLTTSYFSTDTSSGEDRALRQYDLNLYARLNFDGAHEFYLRNRLQYRDYNSGDETPTDDDGLQSFFEEAYYKFDLARFLAAYKGQPSDSTFTLTAGRQFVDWATGLVLSQYLDGLKADFTSGAFTASLLAGVTTYGTTDFDTARPYFDKSTYRGFYGGMVSLQANQFHRPFAYVLVQRDYNKDRDLTLSNGDTLQFDYNSYYVGFGSTGALSDNLRYTLENVYEGGRTYSTAATDFSSSSGDTFQDKDAIQAWAAQATLDYLFNDPHKSKVSGAFIIASGDADRQSSSDTFGGNYPGTRDHAFNGLGLVSAGYAFAPQVSNLTVLKAGASTFPLAPKSGTLGRLQLGAEVLVYGKTMKNGPIDESTDEGQRYLGTELGTYVNWRVMEDLTAQARYSVFFPGSAIASDASREFFYVSLTYAF